MRLIFATPVYPPEIGGPATYTKELCERISADNQITVIAYADAAVPFPNTKLISISKHQPLPLRITKYFFSILRASKCADLIYVQNAMAAGLPVALACIFSRIPFVLKFVGDEAWERAAQHQMTNKRLEEFLERPEGSFKIKAMIKIQRFVLRRAARVTTPSVYLKDLILKVYGVAPEKIIVNYNANEKPENVPLLSKANKFQILTTARLVKWKGIDGVIKAVSILKNKFPEIRLVVAGDGPEMENLKKVAEQSGITEIVDFLGKVSRIETWQLKKSSGVYVLNSTYEGLPHTVLASFAAQIPVIATDILGTNEAVYNEKTGLLVEPGNIEALARAIEKIFTDSEMRQKIIDGGLKILEEKFSWPTHIKKLMEIFNSVSETKK